MALEETILPGDVQVEVAGVSFVFTERLRHYAEEAFIDFNPEHEEGFIVTSQTNPSSC